MLRKFLRFLGVVLADPYAGLGISQASLVSSVCDKTGDDGSDAQVKVKRLINEVGPDFCLITNWPFLRQKINFTITSAAYRYSGASYIPSTFRKVLTALLLDQNSDWFPLYEESLGAMRMQWSNPARYQGRPEKFCITDIESDLYEIAFDRQPDRDFAVELDIEKQWVNLTDSNETVVTKEYFPALSHFISMERYVQQGDTESLLTAKAQWWDPVTPRNSMLGRILNSLSSPANKKQVKVDERQIFPGGRSKRDYNRNTTI